MLEIRKHHCTRILGLRLFGRPNKLVIITYKMLASVIISYFEVNILLNCWIIGRKTKGNKEKGNIIKFLFLKVSYYY